MYLTKTRPLQSLEIMHSCRLVHNLANLVLKLDFGVKNDTKMVKNIANILKLSYF